MEWNTSPCTIMDCAVITLIYKHVKSKKSCDFLFADSITDTILNCKLERGRKEEIGDKKKALNVLKLLKRGLKRIKPCVLEFLQTTSAMEKILNIPVLYFSCVFWRRSALTNENQLHPLIFLCIRWPWQHCYVPISACVCTFLNWPFAAMWKAMYVCMYVYNHVM